MTLEPDALADLYRSHGAMVRRRARSLLGDEEDANDVLQEIFVSLHSKPEQFRAQSSISTFLYTMTTNLCLNKLRDRKNRARLLELHVKPRNNTHAQVNAPAEKLAVVRDILARVPDELANAAVYYYMDEMTHDEIAAVLGCSRRHVGDLLVRFHEHASKLAGNVLRSA